MFKTTSPATSSMLHRQKNDDKRNADKDSNDVAQHNGLIQKRTNLMHPMDSTRKMHVGSPSRLKIIWTIVYPIVLILGSSFCFSLSYYAAKSLSGISGIELGAVRSALMAVMLLVPSAFQRKIPDMFAYGKARTKLMIRCSLGVIGTICIYTGVKFIDLPDFTAIQYTYLVITALFARIFLKEKFGVVKFFATLLALLGVVMVTKPDFFKLLNTMMQSYNCCSSARTHSFNDTLSLKNETILQQTAQAFSTNDNKATHRSIGVILSLCSALVSASVFCVVKKLVTGENALKSSVIVFNCSWFTAIALLIISFFHRLISHTLPTPTWQNGGFVILGSLSALSAHLLQNEALRVSSATFVAIGRSSSIVFGFVFQSLISWQSVTQKHTVSFVGIAIIVLSVTIISLDAMFRRTNVQPADVGSPVPHNNTTGK